MHTGMGLSFDSATMRKSSASFSAHDIIHDTFNDLYYHPHWENEKFILTEFRLAGTDTIFRRDEPVSYIVGSGQHTNSHMINVNGYVYQAPATYYTQKQTWDLPPGFENGFNSRFSRMIELECMSCHNAFPKMVLGSSNKYESIPQGIDCERCHGPGSIHIREMTAGHVIDAQKQIDYTIVNPAKLPMQLQLDICQRCHIQGNAVLKDGKSWYDFKPGMHLSDVMNVFMPVYKGAEDEHIMASHAERMKRSKCYLVSVKLTEENTKSNPTLYTYRAAMTCVSCHNPHVSVKTTDQSQYNKICQSCHHTKSSGILPNPVVVAGECRALVSDRNKAEDNCVSCHMPKNGTIDIPHVSTTDHWIRRPVSKSEKEKIRQFVGLACINSSAVDRRTMGQAYLAYFEKFVADPAFLDSAKAYFDDSDKTLVQSAFRELIRWAFLKKDYVKVIDYINQIKSPLDSLKSVTYTNADAWTAYRVGEAYHETGQFMQAISFMQKAVELAPYELDFRNKLAGWQMDAGLNEKAEKNYRFVISENPQYVSSLINYGFLTLSVKQDVKGAQQMYQRALDLDPDNLQALLNMAGVLLFQSRTLEATIYLRRVIAIDPENTIALNLLRKINK